MHTGTRTDNPRFQNVAKRPQDQPFLRLHDGRRLAFGEYGDPHGWPVFFFHGTPGSHFDWHLFGADDTARSLGIRLIAVDRPGIGLSSFQPGRRFLDWPDDVAALAGHLGFTRFSILGYSSGGAYALACALKIPDHLAQVVTISADGPYDLPGLTGGMEAGSLWFLRLSRNAPTLYRWLLRGMGLAARRLPWLYQRGFQSLLPEVDRSFFARQPVRQACSDTLLEASRQGPAGAQWDTALMVSSWDFRPEDIQIPVWLWYGGADRSTSPSMGRFLAEAIPNSIECFYPEEGHLSLLPRNSEAILKALLP